MGGMGNASYQLIQHKIDTLKKNMINEGIAIIGPAGVNSNRSKITITENIYNMTDRWLKTRSISTGYNQASISDGPFQRGDTDIMEVEKVSCRSIATGQEFMNLGLW